MRHIRPRHTAPSQFQSGFTLIEVMVVVALIAILAALAAPSWSELFERAAIRTALTDFTKSLDIARNQANHLNSPVTVCPSSNGTNCTDTPYDLGWIVRTGPQTNAATQIVLQDNQPNIKIRMDTATPATRRITFLPTGLPAANFNGAAVQVCPKLSEHLSLTRLLNIDRTGNITPSKPGTCTI